MNEINNRFDKLISKKGLLKKVVILPLLLIPFLTCKTLPKQDIFEKECKQWAVKQKASKENYGKLTIGWAGVMDNGVEDINSKAIKSRLHILVYDDNCRCPEERYKYKYYLSHKILQGPRKNKKWHDGEKNYFNDLEIFKWRGKKDSVLVFIYGERPLKQKTKPFLKLAENLTKDKFSEENIFNKNKVLFCERIFKRKFGRTELYRSSYRSSKEVIEKFQEKSPVWLKDVWPKFVDEETHAMYLKLKTMH